MLLRRSSPRRNRFAPTFPARASIGGCRAANRNRPRVAILETGAVIDPAVDRTVSSADLPLLGGMHQQWRPGRQPKPRIHLPRGLIAESGGARVRRRRCHWPRFGRAAASSSSPAATSDSRAAARHLRLPVLYGRILGGGHDLEYVAVKVDEDAIAERLAQAGSNTVRDADRSDPASTKAHIFPYGNGRDRS